MWQKCPICNGEGKISNTGTSSSTFQTCPTCQGNRIISKVSGLPPATVIDTIPTSSPDSHSTKPTQGRGDVTYG